MRIEYLDRNKGIIKILIESFEDLYFLRDFIKIGDIVSAYTSRATLDGEKRVKLRLSVKVEKIELKEEGLRVGGKIQEEIKNIKRGYHFFTFKPGDRITIIKENLENSDIRILEEFMKNQTKPEILLIIVDVLEGIAEFLVLSNFSIVKRESYNYNYPKSYGEDYIEKYADRFIKKVLNIINEKYKDLKKYFLVRDKVSEGVLKKLGIKNVVFTSATSIQSLLREQRDKILKNVREAYEEKVMEEIEKKFLEDKVVFGIGDVKKYLDMGLIEKIILTTDFYFRNKEELNEIIKRIGDNNVVFIFTKNVKEKLNNLGGIIGIVRFKIEEF